MSYEVRANPVFESDKADFLKNRPLAKKDIEAALESFKKDPRQGDRIPGISPQEIRKARWPLKSYQMGARGGLRIVFVINEEKKAIVPLSLWQKKDMTNEGDVLALVKKRLKETIEALKSAK
jgi:hypothetical protein